MALPAMAADTPQMLPAGDHAAWQAIGRVNLAGYKSRRSCTGTLIAPDLVLTAAHCVTRNDGSPLPVGDMRFVAGWFRGEHAGVAHVDRVTYPEEWTRGLQSGKAWPAVDIAFLHLVTQFDAVEPLPVQNADTRDALRILGYRWDRPHALSDSGTCPFNISGGTGITPCQVTFGTSGAPVLQHAGGNWHVIGTVSATGRGQTYFAPWGALDLPDSD